MKNKLSMLLALTLATTLGTGSALATPPAKDDVTTISLKSNFKAAVTFKDVANDDWSLRFVTEMNIKNVISGYEDGSFRPSANVSHEEAIIMVLRTMGLTDTAKTLDSKIAADLTAGLNVSTWARSYVALALQKNLLTKADLTAPQGHADREWVTELVVRAMGLQLEAETHMKDSLTFKDSKEISADAIGYIAVAAQKGIINGYLDNTFQPHKPVKRSEMAVILVNSEHYFEYDEDRQKQTAGQVFGTLKALQTTGLTLTTSTNQEITYKLAAQNYVFINQKAATFGELKSGMSIRVLLNAQSEIVFIDAKTEAPKRETIESRAHGTVQLFTAPLGTTTGTITLINPVRAKVDKKVTLPVATDAKVTLNGQAKTFTDIKTGDFAHLTIVNNTVVEIDVIPGLTKQPDTKTN